MLRSRAFIITFAVATTFVASLSAEEAFIREKSTDRNFPREVTVRHGENDYLLQATGATVRKKFIFKVYAIAHYMEAATFPGIDEALEAARSGEHACQITMEFARGVDAKKIRDAYREGFEKNSSEEDLEAIRPYIALFVAYFENKIEKNEQIVLQRFPDGTVLTTVAGKEMDSLHDPMFATVLWDIWLGEHSIVDRKKLVNLALEEENDDNDDEGNGDDDNEEDEEEEE